MTSAGSSSAAESQFSVVEENPNGQISAPPCLKEFSFADLKTATSNFGHKALLGAGAYGRVYIGWFDEKTLSHPSESGIGMAVAIKIYYPETIQAFDQWQSEVNILGRRYHPNLIELLGYCWEDEKLVLVYEFMHKGSLDNHLLQSEMNQATNMFTGDVFKPLSWDIRLKIAIGAARGLVYLHSLEKPIIYRDFKSSAILLDANYNPKLSDFGLAKLWPSGDKTHVTTRMMGTDGYVAPEYFESGHLTVKSDVYSFGIVLLELLTGLRAGYLIQTNGNLVEWLKPMLSQPKTLMDVQMKGQYSLGAACNATQLTLKCLEVNHKYRPSMKEVLEVLVQIEAMTSMEEDPEVLEQIEAVTSMAEDPEVLEHITTVTSMKEVREVLEQIEAVTSKKEVPEVLEHIETIEEKPKNSNYRSRQSTAARRYSFLQGLIDEHRKAAAADESRNTMISHLLVLQQSQPDYYTDEIIKGLIIVMLLAATDTSAVTLEWAMSNLLNHPDVLNKARAEIESVLDPDQLMNEPDLSKLHYLQNIISETLRLYPAAPLLVPHLSSDDCFVEGYYIPRDTMLFINAWAIQRDPKYWDDSTSFKPERFESGEPMGYKLMPFGLGRRACPGVGLAQRVVGLTLGSLIQCFDWERVDGKEVDMSEGKGLTMPRVVPLEAMCKARPILNKRS